MGAFFGTKTYQSPGDGGKTAAAILETADQTPPALRACGQ